MKIKRFIVLVFLTLSAVLALGTTAYCNGITCGSAAISSSSVGNTYSSGSVFTLSSYWKDQMLTIHYYAYNSDGELEKIKTTYTYKSNYYSQMNVTKTITLKDYTYDDQTYSKWRLYKYNAYTSSLSVNYSTGTVRTETVNRYTLYFVGVNPVTDISDVPEAAYVGEDLTLTGTISPSELADKEIIWSVKDAGDTGAVINNNVLTADHVGNAVIRATVEDGITVGTDYTQDFNIKVLLGDVDYNGTVDRVDAAILLKYLCGEISLKEFLTNYNINQAYVNDDDEIDVLDAVEILKIMNYFDS